MDNVEGDDRHISRAVISAGKRARTGSVRNLRGESH